ncbi:MAG: CpaF family protein [Selenomonadaceae bacterium]
MMSLLLQRLGRAEDIEDAPKPIFAARKESPGEDEYQQLKLEIHRRIVDEMDLAQQRQLTSGEQDRKEVEGIIGEYCNNVLEENPFAVPRADRQDIVSDVLDEILGLGPIEPLLKDESVTEIMINGPRHVFVERMGKLQNTSVQFQDEAHLMNIVERIVAPLGRRIDESSPLVDARLPDGSRVNIIIPPLALSGPCITIRKFARQALSIENLIGFGSLDEEMAMFLRACVKARLNIIVSGGTGSGKTTMLNVVSSFIPSDERIVTIEDAAELRLLQEHVVTLESRPANIEGKGQITIRDLVCNALRMRPDRIIVGEVRSGEALDMLQAMNTGHDGSLTTAHANSPRDVLSRLETMVLMAGMDLPVRAIREQICSAVDLIVQQSRMRDGSRKITYITEVQNMEGNVIILQDLFRFEQLGIDENGKILGSFRHTGIRPRCIEKFEASGIKLPPEMFDAVDDEAAGDWGN